MRISLISCGKQKRATRSRAADLYTSPLFRMTKRLVEAEIAEFGAFYIHSAKHGLLAPDDEIEPYEHRLQQNERKAWSQKVVEKLDRLGLRAAELVVFAGREYVVPLRDHGLKIVEPLKGLMIGERLAYLKSKLGA